MYRYILTLASLLLATPLAAQSPLDQIKALAGEWKAPLDSGGTMVNIFKPFAYGTKVMAQEFENGKYITSTIFYMVGSELHADHFCDFQNEPRYTIRIDSNIVRFNFRSATNLDTHPVHFHSTTWRIVDHDHLVQDWYIAGEPHPHPVHMEFIRQK